MEHLDILAILGIGLLLGHGLGKVANWVRLPAEGITPPVFVLFFWLARTWSCGGSRRWGSSAWCTSLAARKEFEIDFADPDVGCMFTLPVNQTFGVDRKG